jgi:hypothetical protein
MLVRWNPHPPGDPQLVLAPWRPDGVIDLAVLATNALK